ncbi:MAG: hypothetical protein V2A58_18600, partial [Planctomycetota bacterium]
EKMERKLPLMMGPDAKDGRASFKVYAWTTGGVPDAKVYMRLNHKLLPVKLEDGRYVALAPKGVFRAGKNELSVWCSEEAARAQSLTILHEVLVEVAY